jgi:Clathrin light chain
LKLFLSNFRIAACSPVVVAAKMSNFPSIEEFDSGRVTAVKLEDGDASNDLLDSAEDDFLAREQAILGDDAEFFQSATNTTSPPTQGEAAFFGGGQGSISEL